MAAKNLVFTVTAFFLLIVFLQSLFGVYAILATASFMVFDVGYFLQVFCRIFVLKLTSTSRSILTTSEHVFVVLPCHLDLMLHMNNARYPRQCDFSRIEHWFQCGVRKAFKEFPCHMVVGAFTIRYRRSLELFQKVTIKTKVVCWDDKAFYVEQRFVDKDDFVRAVATVKQTLVQNKKRPSRLVEVTPGMLVEFLLGKHIESPPPPPEVQHWIDYNSASSYMLRSEQG